MVDPNKTVNVSHLVLTEDRGLVHNPLRVCAITRNYNHPKVSNDHLHLEQQQQLQPTHPLHRVEQTAKLSRLGTSIGLG